MQIKRTRRVSALVAEPETVYKPADVASFTDPVTFERERVGSVSEAGRTSVRQTKTRVPLIDTLIAFAGTVGRHARGAYDEPPSKRRRKTPVKKNESAAGARGRGTGPSTLDEVLAVFRSEQLADLHFLHTRVFSGDADGGWLERSRDPFRRDHYIFTSLPTQANPAVAAYSENLQWIFEAVKLLFVLPPPAPAGADAAADGSDGAPTEAPEASGLLRQLRALGVDPALLGLQLLFLFFASQADVDDDGCPLADDVAGGQPAEANAAAELLGGNADAPEVAGRVHVSVAELAVLEAAANRAPGARELLGMLCRTGALRTRAGSPPSHPAYAMLARSAATCHYAGGRVELNITPFWGPQPLKAEITRVRSAVQHAEDCSRRVHPGMRSSMLRIGAARRSVMEVLGEGEPEFRAKLQWMWEDYLYRPEAEEEEEEEDEEEGEEVVGLGAGLQPA